MNSSIDYIGLASAHITTDFELTDAVDKLSQMPAFFKSTAGKKHADRWSLPEIEEDEDSLGVASPRSSPGPLAYEKVRKAKGRTPTVPLY